MASKLITARRTKEEEKNSNFMTRHFTAPNQQRTLNKLPTELRCRDFVNNHRLSMQNREPNVRKRACDVYVFQPSFHFFMPPPLVAVGQAKRKRAPPLFFSNIGQRALSHMSLLAREKKKKFLLPWSAFKKEKKKKKLFFPPSSSSLRSTLSGRRGGGKES